MRLWHIDLIPYLPKSQLLAQWRELNSIFKKQDNHILINYIYNYSKEYLFVYAVNVVEEMQNRGFKIRNFDNYDTYFKNVSSVMGSLTFNEHNHEYLTICYYNLKEKYLRGQKDFTYWVWEKLDKFYQEQCIKAVLPKGVEWNCVGDENVKN